MKNNFVDIFVLNWNQKNLSLKCIESLTKLTYKNNRIYFIDNGSTDGSHIAVKDQFPAVDILRSEKNLGYSKGNNFGFNAVKEHSKYSIFLNNDLNFLCPCCYVIGNITKIFNFLNSHFK